MAELAEITVGDLDQWLGTLEKPSFALSLDSDPLFGATSDLIADYLPDLLQSDLSDLDLLALDTETPDPLPSLDVICSSLGIAMETSTEAMLECLEMKDQYETTVKDEYETTVEAACWPGSEINVPATFSVMTDTSSLSFTPLDSTPYGLRPAEICPEPPLPEVPFALLSALPPTTVQTLLPLSVRMSMLRLRLRGRGSNRSNKLAALHHFYTERSEQLEAQRFFQLTQAGTTAWHAEQTNHYFDQQHHALIDSMEAYLNQHESQKRKRPADDDQEPPSKRLHLSSPLTPPTTPVMSPMMVSPVMSPMVPSPAMSMPSPAMSMPSPVMSMPSPAMSMPSPAMSMPSPAMSMPSPVMSPLMPSPAMSPLMPSPVMSPMMPPAMPSPLEVPASPLPVPSPAPQAAPRTRPPPLSKRAINLMDAWYLSHQEHPYPSTDLIHEMAEAGGVTSEQVKKWFSNRRMRCRNTKSWREIRQRRNRNTPNVMNEVFLKSELRA